MTERLKTGLALGICCFAVGALLAAPSSGPPARGDSSPAGHSAVRGAPPTAAHAVEGAARRQRIWVAAGGSCDDSRSAAAADKPTSPLCTLDRALALARAGVDILLSPGSYDAIRITGDDAAGTDIRIIGATRTPPAIAGGALDHVRHLVLSGLRFTAKLQLLQTRDVTLQHVDFPGAELLVRQTTGTTVERCHFHDYADLSRAFVAMGNGYSADQPTTRNLLIRGNVFERIQHDAIALYNGYDGVRITANLIQNVTQPAQSQFHSDALQAMGGNGLTVERNVMRNDIHGFLVKDGSATTNLVVRRNVIHDTGGSGLQIYDGVGARIEHNTIWKTSFGVYLWNDERYPETPTVTLIDNVIDRVNAFPGVTIVKAGSNVFRTFRPIGSPAYRGTPNFVAPNRNDYSISSNRPGLKIPRRAIPGAQASDARTIRSGR